MPRYRVEWQWRASWVVDAPSIDIARECSRDPETMRVAYDVLADPDITVIEGGRARRAPPPDAVAVGGELLAPEDAPDEWREIIEADEGGGDP